MTTLRDMPMISVEQKNAFREAALKVEQERDRIKVELENRSHEPDMSASDAYHYCADLIEPHVVDMPHGTECNEQSLCRSVCGSLAYLIAHWQEARGLREERDALAAREASAKNLMNRLIDAPAYHGGPRPATVQEFIDWALGGIDYLTARDARMKAEALEGVNSHNLSRLAKSIGKDAWEMNPIGICRLVNLSAYDYRKQAEGES